MIDNINARSNLLSNTFLNTLSDITSVKIQSSVLSALMAKTNEISTQSSVKLIYNQNQYYWLILSFDQEAVINKCNELVDRLNFLQNTTSIRDLKYSMNDVISIIGNSLTVINLKIFNIFSIK